MPALLYLTRSDFVALPIASFLGVLACKHLLLPFVLGQKLLRCEVMRTEGFQAAAPQPGVPTRPGAVGLALWSCWVMGSGFPALGAGDTSSPRGAAPLSERGLTTLPQIQPLHGCVLASYRSDVSIGIAG